MIAKLLLGLFKICIIANADNGRFFRVMSGTRLVYQGMFDELSVRRELTKPGDSSMIFRIQIDTKEK